MTKKLNEAFFQKTHNIEDQREKEKLENAPVAPNTRRRRSSVIEGKDLAKLQKKITNPKGRRTSLVDDERSIHDAYHFLLKEFHRVRSIPNYNPGL